MLFEIVWLNELRFMMLVKFKTSIIVRSFFIIVLIVNSVFANAQEVDKALEYFKMEQYKNASTEFKKALIKPEQTKINKAYILFYIALSYDRLKDVENAISYYSLSKEAFEQIPNGINDNLYFIVLNNFALLYQGLGQYEKALPLFKQTLLIIKKTSGNAKDYGVIVGNIVSIYVDMGQYEKALPLYEEYLLIVEDTLGNDNTEYGYLIANIATIYRDMGHYEKALFKYKEALSIIEKTLGEDSSDYMSIINNIALTYLYLGQKEKALSLSQNTLSVIEKKLGKDNYSYATALSNLAAIYSDMEQYDEALPLYIEALSITIKTRGKDHPDYGTRLNNLALLYTNMGLYEKALPIAIEALLNAEKVIGVEHPDYGTRLNNLALLYRKMKCYEKALPLFKEALYIAEKHFGKNHPHYIATLNSLAYTLSDIGLYKEALPLYTEVLIRTEETTGKIHTDYDNALNSLAFAYRYLGQFEDALPLFEESLSITEELFGKNHTQYAITLSNLSLIYSDLGQYQKALALSNEALSIVEKTENKECVGYGTIINNLGLIYRYLGQYREALSFSKESLLVTEKTLGKEHPDYGMRLNNLAEIYSELGQSERALPLFEEALTITKESLGEEHVQYIVLLSNLARLYQQMGQYQKALSLDQRALLITEKTLGKEHLFYGRRLLGVAGSYQLLEQYEEASSSYKEALIILEKTIGKQHPDYLVSLNNYASLYQSMGNYEKAYSMYREFILRAKETMGKNHPEYILGFSNLAMMYQGTQQYDKALPLYLEVNEIVINRVKKSLLFLSENEKEEYYETKGFYFEGLNSFALQYNSNSDSIVKHVYNNTLTNKGILLRSTLSMKNAVLSSGDTALINRYDDWLILKKEISKLYSLEKSKRFEDPAVLEEKANKIESELVRQSTTFRDYQKLQETDWEDVRNSLKQGEAAIEFINFNYYDKRWTDSIYYCALVLRKDYDHPKMIYLFEEKQLNDIISSSSAGNSAQLVSQLYGQTRGVSVLGAATSTAFGDSLYSMIWQPLNSMLQGVESVYYSPSGLLHNISFSAIPVNDSTLLMDRYNLSLMSTTADIVFNKEPDFNNAIAAVYGGITYDLTPEEMEATTQKYRDKDDNLFAYTRGWFYNDTLRGGGWSYLNGTLTEAEEVSETLADYDFRVATYTGAKANEESFKALSGKKSPEIIHLATHGFFFPDPKQQKRRDNLMFQQMGDNTYYIADNPLMRSGLLFAGANTIWSGGEIPGELEDGVLTAYEVSNMNLFNTKLVTLSACETGLGDIKGSEGVYGLQRSFKMAGVDYLIMSLWQVPDKETQEFMSLFYKNLTSGQPIAKAFRNTQKVMRQKYEPFYWAGFVLLE